MYILHIVKNIGICASDFLLNPALKTLKTNLDIKRKGALK